MLRSLWDKLRGKQPPEPAPEPSPHDPVIPFQTEKDKEAMNEDKREILKKQHERSDDERRDDPTSHYDVSP